MRPPLRFLVLVPLFVAMGSVVLDFVLLEFFGVLFLLPLSLLVFVGVGLLLTLRLPRQPVGWLLLGAGTLFQVTFAAQAYAWAAFIRVPGTLPHEVAFFIGYASPHSHACFLPSCYFRPAGHHPHAGACLSQWS